MNNQQGNDWTVKAIIWGGVALLVYKIVEAIGEAIKALLLGLVDICLIASGIIAAYWIYRYISDKQYGQHKLARKANKLESELEYLLEHTPEHLHEEITEHYRSEQRALLEPKAEKKTDVILDRTKQVVSIFNGGRNGNKDSHR